VRVASKIKAINGFRAEVEDPFAEGNTLMVDIYLTKQKTLEAGMLVEFIGEIEQTQNSDEVLLKARVVKAATGFHKMVY